MGTELIPLSWQTLLSQTKSTQCGMGLTCKLQTRKRNNASQKNINQWEKWITKLTIDSSVGTVSPSPLLCSLVHLDVWYEEGIHIQTFHLSIALSVLKQIKNELSRFRGPTSLTVRVPVLSLGSPSNTSAETGEGNGLLVSYHIFKVPLRLEQW